MRGVIIRLSFGLIVGVALAACSPVMDNPSGDAPLAVRGGAAGIDASLASGSTGSVYDFGLASGGFRAQTQSLPFVRSAPAQAIPFPIELNRTVEAYVDEYRAQPAGIEGSFARIKPYLAEMTATLQKRGLPPELVYLTFAESGFSSSGAGPWQLSRATARRYGLLINNWIDERRDPIKSTRAAAAYLSELHEDIGADWRMTLIAWNNGEGGADRYLALRDASYTQMLSRLPRRTRSLLNRFMATALIARQMRAEGQLPEADAEEPSYRIVSVKGGTSLRTIALRQHTSVDLLRDLNPALFRYCAPPDEAAYPVRVPAAPLRASL